MVDLQRIAESRVGDPLSTWPDHTQGHARTLLGDFLWDFHCLRCWLETEATKRLQAPFVETGWLQTYTCRKVHPLEPDPGDIDIEDIAHHLSNICRYTGATKEFYSVAQHSVLVSGNVPEEHALWGLLHDAPEAYLCDLPRPLKQWMRNQGMTWYDAAEEAMMRAIARRFGLSWPEPECVSGADNLLLVTEARDLMSPLHPDWHYCEANGYPVLPDRIVPWRPEVAKAFFLVRFKHLTKEVK